MENKTRKGDWMETYTGIKFYPMDPREDEICIEDIAHSLAYQCRFNGHCRFFYSVAQHSVIGSEMINPKYALAFLLHDAAEAYISDIIRPVKVSLNSVKLKNVELKIQEVILKKWKYDISHSAVENIDNKMLSTEAVLLMPRKHPWNICDIYLPYVTSIIKRSWGPEEAEEKFLQRFEFLTTEFPF